MGPVDVLPTRTFCLFTHDATPLACDVEAVVGVVEPTRLVRLPLCPSPIVGMCPHRGGFIPVVRPTGRAAGGPDGSPRRGTILVLRTRAGDLGLLIDREGIMIAEDPEVRPRSDETAGPGLAEGFVATGAVVQSGLTLPLLDPDATWSGLRSAVERTYAACLDLEPAEPCAAGEHRADDRRPAL